MSRKNIIRILCVLLSPFILFMTACENDLPTASGPDQSLQAGFEEVSIQTDQGIFYIPNLKQEYQQSLAKPGPNDSVFYRERFVLANKGDTLRLGNDRYGKSRIFFDPGDLPKDVLISFEWRASGNLDGGVGDATFGPHGLTFNHPVKVVLSYKAVDLTGINEDDLKFFYFNEKKNKWILQNGTLNKNKKTYRARLNHFSRYAVAYGR